MERICKEYWVLIGIGLIYLFFVGCVKQEPRQYTPEEINAQLFDKNYSLVEIKREKLNVDSMNATVDKNNKERDYFMAGEGVGIKEEKTTIKNNEAVTDKTDVSGVTVETDGNKVIIKIENRGTNEKSQYHNNN